MVTRVQKWIYVIILTDSVQLGIGPKPHPILNNSSILTFTLNLLILANSKVHGFPYYLSRTFLRQGPKMREWSKSPIGFFRSVYCGESSPKFQKYDEQKANGALTRENQNANNKSAKKHNRSKSSTHSQREKEIKRDYEEEKEGSLVPIFPPLRFRIVKMFPNSVDFCFQVLALWGKRGWFILNLIGVFCIEFGVL